MTYKGAQHVSLWVRVPPRKPLTVYTVFYGVSIAGGFKPLLSDGPTQPTQPYKRSSASLVPPDFIQTYSF